MGAESNQIKIDVRGDQNLKLYIIEVPWKNLKIWRTCESIQFIWFITFSILFNKIITYYSDFDYQGT